MWTNLIKHHFDSMIVLITKSRLRNLYLNHWFFIRSFRKVIMQVIGELKLIKAILNQVMNIDLYISQHQELLLSLDFVINLM